MMKLMMIFSCVSSSINLNFTDSLTHSHTHSHILSLIQYFIPLYTLLRTFRDFLGSFWTSLYGFGDFGHYGSSGYVGIHRKF